MDSLIAFISASDVVFLFLLSGGCMFCGLMAMMIIKDKWITRTDVKNALNDLTGKD